MNGRHAADGTPANERRHVADADARSGELAADAGVYKTLLESTRAIPWKLDWPSLRFAYIGPQIEQLLGWPQASWKTVDDWATRMHPEDRERVVAFCVAQSQSGIDHEADYRALTRDGGYVWIRDVVHVKRDESGEVTALIGFMFDISERKRAEEELLGLHRELEALTVTDALTGIANRRMFDQRLDIEWNDARRSGKPLSLLILDIDHFKPYNDRYGHPAGDQCIRAIAAAARGAARRPRDVAARLGGDEFVILLPETDAETARSVGAEITSKVVALALPHGAGEAGPCVSVSLGIATAVAGRPATAAELVEEADRMLYMAKGRSRDDIEPAPATAKPGRAG